MIKYSEALKEIRKQARENGMTFKAINVSLNGGRLYGLFNRVTGEKLVSNYQLWTAYEDSQNGYFESLRKKHIDLSFSDKVIAFKRCLLLTDNKQAAIEMAHKKYRLNAVDADQEAWFEALP